ncbi:glutathione S-transferase family protein [Crenalkalicoccus roseus]|uniref:glutathione S-transferase family protein n=1 Tax=Crenalkalicoccus roseus TaxID=1485588 RepID=UPI00108110F5|nr:glutathione S-transferase family protein [Crenalkalicoccus roseus]
MSVVLHGPSYSTYARTVRMVLEEKGIPYTLHEVDLLRGEGQSPEHLARHPWGKVPVLEHDGFALYETFAIGRYLDEAFPGPRLQPEEVRARARMTQICGIIDSYAYGAAIGKVFWQAAVVPMQGGTPDQAVVAQGLEQSARAFRALEALMPGEEGFLCGGGLTLADLHLVPVVDYFAMVPPGRSALEGHPRLSAWWRRIAERPSVVKTKPRLG